MINWYLYNLLFNGMLDHRSLSYLLYFNYFLGNVRNNLLNFFYLLMNNRFLFELNNLLDGGNFFNNFD